MKRSILFLAIGFAATTANAQKVPEKQVPTPVKMTFTTTYPRTEVEEWELEDGNYEAKFDYNKVDYSVLYDANGAVLETEMEIKTSELPKAVTDYVAKNLSGKKIEEAAKIDAKGTITYEAEVDDVNYIFDSNGNFLSKKEEKDDNDKDEKKK